MVGVGPVLSAGTGKESSPEYLNSEDKRGPIPIRNVRNCSSARVSNAFEPYRDFNFRGRQLRWRGLARLIYYG